ncbi:MAG: hypothetical protein QHH02_08575 [Syntrophomonadaceae bacterium]|nr:hypothetical protein [Syntrophomonadaceae bacterium]
MEYPFFWKPRPAYPPPPARKPAESTPLAFLAKDNVVGILDEVTSQLRYLSEVVNRAVSNVETITSVINFLEVSGGELQKQLLEIAEQVRLQAASSQLSSTDRLPVTPEMISEILQSPHFKALVEEVVKKRK